MSADCLIGQETLFSPGNAEESTGEIHEETVEYGPYTQGEFEKYQIWRFMPVINVDRTEDIPADWPGLMGCPITMLDKCGREQFEIMDLLAPEIDGKMLYRRIIARNKKPENLGEYWVAVTYGVKIPKAAAGDGR